MALAFSSSKFWVGVFGLWLMFLSGALAGVVGSPGIIQSINLQSLLKYKQQNIDSLQDQVTRLEAEAELLQKSRITQEREIRRVLGYAAEDEIIFDFSSGLQL